jgi:hypothetical protein
MKAVGNKSDHFFYPPKEAGVRAKDLIDQTSERYHAPHVIIYAIFDYPYLQIRCRDMLHSRFPDAPGPEPGAIIVGKDGQHCGILDNEGTKYVHSNPSARKVTYDSLATVEKYFPHGASYKRYPHDPLLQAMMLLRSFKQAY